MKKINWYKISVFTLLTYALSWFISYLMARSGLTLNNTKAALLIAVFYMTMPALCVVVVQKLIFRKSLKIYGWSLPRKKQKYFGLLPIISFTILVLTGLFIYIFGNLNLIQDFGRLDFSSENFTNVINSELAAKDIKNDFSTSGISALPPFLLYGIIIFQGIFIGGIVNVPVTFGEEFGWRGFLSHETETLGFWGSSLLTGIIWGIWHFPLIFIGLNYPHHHELGLLLMVLFTLSLSPLLLYVRIKTGSILAPSVLHGMINGTAGIFGLCVVGFNELYSSVAGAAGIAAGVLVSIAVYLLDYKSIRAYYQEADCNTIKSAR